MQKIIDKIGESICFIIDRYVIILIAAFLLTAAGLYFTLRLPLQSDLAALLPDDYESVSTLRAINKKVGGFETLDILIQGKNFESMKAYADLLAEELLSSENVNYVSFKQDVDFYESNALLYASLDELKEIRDRIESRVVDAKLEYNPFYVDLDEDMEEEAELNFDDLEEKYQITDDKVYFVNEDKTVLVLRVYARATHSDIQFARDFYQEVQSLVARTNPASYDESLFVEFGGNFKNKVDEYEVIIGDVKSTAAIGLSAVFLLIMLYFRRPMASIFIGIPLAMSLCWTFGLTYLIIGKLNTMTVFLFVVLFGLGIDFGIHIFSRYVEERKHGADTKEALNVTIRKTGRALATAALTTSAAFYSLMLADFRGFYEFGFIAGTGIIFALLSMTIVCPAFIIIFEKLNLVRIKAQEKGSRDYGKIRMPFSKTILAIGIGLVIFSVIILPKTQFEYDFTNLRSNLPHSIEVKHKLSAIFKESNSPAIVLANSREELIELEEYIEEKIEKDETPTISKFRSIYSMLPQGQDEKLEIIAEIVNLLDDQAMAQLSEEEREKAEKLLKYTKVGKLGIQDLPESITRIFGAKDGTTGEFAYIIPKVALRHGRNAIAFAEDVRDIEIPSGKVFHASNSSVIFADMLLMMMREGKRAVLITLIAVFLFVLIDLRSLRGSLLVLTPLLVGLFWLIGVMFVSGMKLNFYNMVIIPSIIGIGIDNGVHIYHRYLQEGKGSIVKVLRFTGGAISISSITTMVGFSGLVFAHHPGLNAIGKLALLGISLALIAALSVLPSVLQLTEARRKFNQPPKKKNTPLPG
jgi:predicted RND superfamily exporter protein